MFKKRLGKSQVFSFLHLGYFAYMYWQKVVNTVTMHSEGNRLIWSEVSDYWYWN